MNTRSGVSRSTARHEIPEEEDIYDHKTASFDLLDELARNVAESVILENGETHVVAKQRTLTYRRTAKDYLRKQHPCCHRAWKSYLLGSSESGDSNDSSGNELSVYDLLEELEIMARRDSLHSNLTLEAN